MIRLMAIRSVSALLFLVAGCAPTVQFSACRCRRLEQDGKLKALDFVSTFEATGLAKQQIVYRVRLIGRGGAPIRSADGRYQTAAGHVGAARSFIVHTESQVFPDISVAIPAGELEFTQEDVPVAAEVTVTLGGGGELARQRCAVPVTNVEEFRPPLERAAPDGRMFWFARPGGRAGPPLLAGPFGSAKAAARAYPAAPNSPEMRRASAYLWFVPLQRTEPPAGELLIGPCVSPADAARVAKVLDAGIWERKVQLRTAPAERIRLATWYARRKGWPGAPQSASLRALRLLGAGLPAPKVPPTTQPWRQPTTRPTTQPRQPTTRPAASTQPK